MSAFENDDGSASGMTYGEHVVAMRKATHLIRSLQDLEEGRFTSSKRKRTPDQAPTASQASDQALMITPEKVALVYNYLIRGGQLGLAIMAARRLGVTPNGVIDATLYFVASIADTGVILLNAATRQLGNAALMCIDVAVDATTDAAKAAAYTVSTLAQYFTFENLDTALNAAVGTFQGVAANKVYSRLTGYANNRNVMFADIADTINRLHAGIRQGRTALHEFQGEHLLLYTPTNDVNHQPSAFIRLADTCAAGKTITDNLHKFEQLVHKVNADALKRPPTVQHKTTRPGTHTRRKASSRYRPNIDELIRQRKGLIYTNALTGRGLGSIRANTLELQHDINEAIATDRVINTLSEMSRSKPRETASLPLGGGGGGNRRTKKRKSSRKTYRKSCRKTYKKTTRKTRK